MRFWEEDNVARNNFFGCALPNKKVQQAITGRNESKIDWLLEEVLGYKKDEDYFKQYGIENRYVADFAFPEERVVIEIDGVSHKSGKQFFKDVLRDEFFSSYKWLVIRIPEWEFDKNQSFYKSLIKQVIDDKRNGKELTRSQKQNRTKLYARMEILKKTRDQYAKRLQMDKGEKNTGGKC